MRYSLEYDTCLVLPRVATLVGVCILLIEYYERTLE
jgi:hypothetical protein